MKTPSRHPHLGGRITKRAVTILLVLSSIVVLFPEQALSAASSSVRLRGSFEGDSDSNDIGLTTSASVIGAAGGVSEGSSAKAHTAPGTMGLAATAGANTLGATANTGITDTWTCPGLCGIEPFPIPINVFVHFDGTLPDYLLRPSPNDPDVFMNLRLEYSVEDEGSFTFLAERDGASDAPRISAVLNTRTSTRDLTSDLVIVGNSVRFSGFTAFLVGALWREAFDGNLQVEPFGDIPQGFTVDFASTFSTQPFPLDPSVTFVSEAGRIAAAPSSVPEPSTLVLLVCGGVALLAARCWRAKPGYTLRSP
jgi:hypothetical protein